MQLRGDGEERVERRDYAEQGDGRRRWSTRCKGSRDRAAVVNPVNGGWLGEGERLSRAGIPTIGYIPQPNYLLAGPATGASTSWSPELLHGQIEVFARALRKMDAMGAAELKGAKASDG